MACQGFPPFLTTKYSNFIDFQRQCDLSVLHDKDSLGSLYNYLETSKAPTTLLTKIISTVNSAPYIAMYDLPTLSSTSPAQYPSTPHDNVTSVAWSTLSHQQLTMYPTIDSLTSKYYNS